MTLNTTLVRVFSYLKWVQAIQPEPIFVNLYSNINRLVIQM